MKMPGRRIPNKTGPAKGPVGLKWPPLGYCNGYKSETPRPQRLNNYCQYLAKFNPSKIVTQRLT